MAVTIGDPAGVGPDLVLAAWAARSRLSLPDFILYGDPAMAASRAARLGMHVPIMEAHACRASEVFPEALPVAPLSSKLRDRPGEPDVADAPGIVESIEAATRDALAGKASAIVTAPISKKNLYGAGFGFPGHTEFIAHLAHDGRSQASRAVMMLAGPGLRTVPVTIHIPLADVPRALTTDLIVDTGRIVARDLRHRFGIESPRMAVAGLNPHAGEGGALGREDDTVVRPAVEAMRSLGLDAFGPLPADTMFHERARSGYDVALCMYHDQALIPAKAIAFDETVNVTLGLPVIRTSPDHGTAFDLAGTGMARFESFVAALRLAADMARRSEA